MGGNRAEEVRFSEMCSAKLKDQAHMLQNHEFQLNMTKKIPLRCCSNRFKSQPGKIQDSYRIQQVLFLVLNNMTLQGMYNPKYSTVPWSSSDIFTAKTQYLLFVYTQLGELASYTDDGWFLELRTLSY